VSLVLQYKKFDIPSADYNAQLARVQSLGRKNSTTRTQDQSNIATVGTSKAPKNRNYSRDSKSLPNASAAHSRHVQTDVHSVAAAGCACIAAGSKPKLLLSDQWPPFGTCWLLRTECCTSLRDASHI